MCANFFLDGNYTQKQINALNNVKSKKTDNKTKNKSVKGDAKTIAADINTYNSDKTKQTNNTELFNYIESVIGMDNFLKLTDANGDGKISEQEAAKLASCDEDSALNSEDIKKFLDDIKSLSSASTTTTSGNYDTTYNYRTNKDGQLVKTSATKTDKTTKKDVVEYSYDENGNIKSEKNNQTGKTTTYGYRYDSKTGKYVKKSAAVRDNNSKLLLEELVYDNNGRLSTRTDTLKNQTTTYKYDSNGKKTSATVRDDKTKANLTEYRYNQNGTLKSTTDIQRKFTTEYKYDSNGKKTSAVRKDDRTGESINEYKYDANGNLTSEVNKLNNRTTTYKYKLNKATGKYITVSATAKNTRTGEVTNEYKYSDTGQLVESNDKIKNQTTTYKYDSNGKRKSATTIANNAKKTPICECTYDKDGRVSTKKEYIGSETGLKQSYFHKFTYDNYGRVASRTVYKGTSTSGQPTTYEYSYPADKFTYEILSRKNKMTGETREYTYNSDHEITAKTDKDKHGDTIRTMKMNKDGTIASMTQGNYTYVYSYETGCIRSKATKYNKSDVDNNGKVKSGAKRLAEKTYDDGELKNDITYDEKEKEKKKVVYTDNKISYYEGSKITSETKGDNTYVYEYDSNGNKTKTKKYKNSDCINGTPKSGAKPVE